jgi:regulator of RNase E activity RraA
MVVNKSEEISADRSGIIVIPKASHTGTSEFSTMESRALMKYAKMKE